MLQQRRDKKTKLIASITASLLFAGLALVIALNRQYFIDQITVWQFKTSSEVINLVDRAGMNDQGKFIYLASKPELDLSKDFNISCDRIENTTSILGCYSDYRIYLYDVTDAQLDGIREVTAAHETLHAVYARLNASEKTKVDALLQNEYTKLENDKNFKNLMNFYDRTEPGQCNNELHSVIGTEFSDISPELETYYSKYFSDRKKVVALDDKYSSVFNNLSARADELVLQMNTLASSISLDTDKYNSDAETLNGDILSFNVRADDGSFSSEAQFYSERSVLSARIDDLNALRVSINDDKTKYDLTLAEYNSISSQSKKLYDSIDSTLVSAPSEPIE